MVGVHLLQDEVEVEGEDAEVVQEVGQPAVAALAGGGHQVEPVLSRLHSCLLIIVIIHNVCCLSLASTFAANSASDWLS